MKYFCPDILLSIVRLAHSQPILLNFDWGLSKIQWWAWRSWGRGGGGVWQIWSCVSDRSVLKTVNKTWKAKETNGYKRNRHYYSRRYLHRSYCMSKYMHDQVSEEISILRGLRRGDSNSPNSPQQQFRRSLKMPSQKRTEYLHMEKTVGPKICWSCSPNNRRPERYGIWHKHREWNKLKNWPQDTKRKNQNYEKYWHDRRHTNSRDRNREGG